MLPHIQAPQFTLMKCVNQQLDQYRPTMSRSIAETIIDFQESRGQGSGVRGQGSVICLSLNTCRNAKTGQPTLTPDPRPLTPAHQGICSTNISYIASRLSFPVCARANDTLRASRFSVAVRTRAFPVIDPPMLVPTSAGRLTM